MDLKIAKVLKKVSNFGPNKCENRWKGANSCIILNNFERNWMIKPNAWLSYNHTKETISREIENESITRKVCAINLMDLKQYDL